MGDVDAGLVRLARDRGGAVVTADANLAKVARALSVPVRSINALAAGLRLPFAAGEHITLKLIREGRDHGQGVGYLEDGTMVVVEQGSPFLGTEVRARVTNVLQTTTGRMVFAALAEAEEGSKDAASQATASPVATAGPVTSDPATADPERRSS
jgi:uncharacterized protein YacL